MNEEVEKKGKADDEERDVSWLAVNLLKRMMRGGGGGGLMGGAKSAPANSSVMSPNNSDVLSNSIDLAYIIPTSNQNIWCYLSSENIPEACGDQEVCWVHVSSNVAHCGQRVGHLNNIQVFIYCNVFWFDKISKKSWKKKWIRIQKINLGKKKLIRCILL